MKKFLTFIICTFLCIAVMLCTAFARDYSGLHLYKDYYYNENDSRAVIVKYDSSDNQYEIGSLPYMPKAVSEVGNKLVILNSSDIYNVQNISVLDMSKEQIVSYKSVEEISYLLSQEHTWSISRNGNSMLFLSENPFSKESVKLFMETGGNNSSVGNNLRRKPLFLLINELYESEYITSEDEIESLISTSYETNIIWPFSMFYNGGKIGLTGKALYVLKTGKDTYSCEVKKSCFGNWNVEIAQIEK